MLAVFVVVVAGLYFAREVMVPITLAVLLSFVLAPLVGLLRTIHVPRVAAVLLAVVLAVGVIVALAGLIGVQVASLAGNLSRYQYTFEQTATAVQGYTLGRLADLTERFGRSTAPPTPPAHQPGSPAPDAPKPVPVQVEAPPSTPLQLAREFLAPIVAPLEDAGIMFVVAIFVLLQQDDLRDRLIRLFGSADLHRTTVAMDDAGRRLSRYFLTQLAVNAAFGCVVGVGLAVIGVPSPILWGVLGALLRFVPYIGSGLAALLPVALASGVEPGWGMAIWTVALFGVVELTTGQVVEPLLYGHSTGLSPVSVIVAAIFWSWLWGPIGLILSTPLTLCLVVLGRHVPQLEFLDVVLGDRPALTPVETLYQRILAGDGDEALEQAEQILADRSLSSYYDEIALPALRLAVTDMARGLLRPDHAAKVVATVLDLVADLDSHDDTDRHPTETLPPTGPVAPPDPELEPPRRPPAGPDFDAGDAVSPWDSPTPVLCVAGRGAMDAAAAAMLAQLLGKHGLGARVAPHSAVARGRVSELTSGTIAMVCVCYVEVGGSGTHLRYLLRRLRQHLTEAHVLIALLPRTEPALDIERVRAATDADLISDSLTGSVSACLHAAEARSRSEQHQAQAA